MNKKQKIKLAYANGLTDFEELAARYGSSAKYVAKVVREANLRPCAVRKLNEAEYINAYMLGKQSVRDLAAFFSVSEKTIKRFHTHTRIKEKLAAYKFALSNRHGTIDNTEHCSLKDAYNILRAICDRMEPLADDYKHASDNFKKIRKIIEELEQIKP